MHIKVGQTQPRIDCLDKQVKGQQQCEYSHAFVIVRPGHGSGNVAGANGDQGGGDEAGAGIPNLFAEEIGDEGGVGSEKGRSQHVDLADMDSEAEEAEEPVNDGGGDHETRVECTADDATKRVRAIGIEPVPKLVEAILCEVESGAVIEVGIELMDHGLVAENAEEASDESEDIDEAKDCDSEQKLLLFGFHFEI
jgi:hypothetical protein